MAIHQMFLGLGAGAKKTYMDDVFSTYLTTGNATARSVNTGVDMTEGGLIWSKCRTDSHSHFLFDTERGVNKFLRADGHNAEYEESGSLTAFNNNGFSLGTWSGVNQNSADHAHFSFRKAKGFFDIVTYTGNGADNRAISHSLGSVPGMILVKNLSDSNENWVVYHNHLNGGDNAEEYFLQLNSSLQRSDSDIWAVTTGSVFSVGSNGKVNGNNKNYVAYIFAGGESTNALARSVLFTGTSHKLSLAASDDFHLTGDFTIEGWFYPTGSSNEHIWSLGSYTTSGGVLFYIYDNKLYIQEWVSGSRTDRLLMDPAPPQKQWSHIAIVRSGSTINAYVNGTLIKSWTYSDDYGSSSNKTFYIAGSAHSNGSVNISNFRVVKGTAVYTSSFRPPTEPLTNITNTKLLCCNNSSATGSTVTPGTITASGVITTSTDSPFDDPAGFKFGDSGSENVIKTGSYIGTGASGVAPVINLGWEPQWLLVKMSDSASGGEWYMLDTMRGWGADNSDNGPATFSANSSGTEEDWGQYNYDLWTVNPTGFTVGPTDKYNVNNTSNKRYIWMAIRRPDGYVGKPPELGTDVFAMDTGNNSFPAMDTGFLVDFGLAKKPATTDNWRTGGRLTGTKALYTNATDAQSNHVNQVWDSNVGFWKSIDSSFQAWAWKRHAGFDVVCYEGTQTVQDIKHSLNKAPEMMWIKNRDNGSYNWSVYHSGLGDNRFKLYLNTNQDYTNDAAAWNNTAPTSTHFTLGIDATANKSGDSFIAMLFSSISGISSMGAYTGNGQTGSSGPFITTGFSPRFIIIKRTDTAAGYGWNVHDTTRGIDNRLRIQTTAAQATLAALDLSSTGFRVKTNNASYNTSSGKYVYYAHA
jgi:hypothetical protein